MPPSPRTDRVLLVGHGHPRYQDALADWTAELRTAGCAVTRTSPRTWYGEEVLTALAEPRDLVVYFGHGRPGAWVGYARLNAGMLGDVDPREAHRLVAGLCCDSLTAPAEGRALPTAILGDGLATHYLGYDGAIPFVDNETALARVLGAYCDARAAGADGVRAVLDTIGDGWAPGDGAAQLQCIVG